MILPPVWTIKRLIVWITNLKFQERTKIRIKRPLRENNKGADYKVNLGCKEEQFFSFIEFGSLSCMMKGFVKLHKVGIPTLRCRIS